MERETELGSWHSASYVGEWIERDVLADMLDFPRRLSIALVADAGVQPTRVVDLGSGPGTYLQVFLEAFPHARGTWIDTSNAMLEVAKERLSSFAERVDFVVSDAETLTPRDVGSSEVFLTSRTVHHFSQQAIRDFYRLTASSLTEGGFFFNLDHYGTPGDWEQAYRRVRPLFVGKRPKQAPHRHDEPFNQIDTHVKWLKDAGFDAPDVPWRTFYTALLAARKL